MTCPVPTAPASSMFPLNQVPLLCSFGPCLNYRLQSLVTFRPDLLLSEELPGGQGTLTLLSIVLPACGTCKLCHLISGVCKLNKGT